MRTKLIYQSSYDRGLEHLLRMWPEIKERVPEATLEICYGWNLFAKAYANNPERLAWMDEMNDLMTQEGITHHGRISQKELNDLRSKCDIWAYPTHFEEIFCIGAVEAQLSGLIPVVTDYAALKETVGSGIKVVGDIYDPQVKENYITALVDVMTNDERWKDEPKKGKKFAKKYYWENISSEWLKVIDER